MESVRASRTDLDMDVGGCRQKLLKMFPGERRRTVSATGFPGLWVKALWVVRPRGRSLGRGPHYLASVQPGHQFPGKWWAHPSHAQKCLLGVRSGAQVQAGG